MDSAQYSRVLAAQAAPAMFPELGVAKTRKQLEAERAEAARRVREEADEYGLQGAGRGAGPAADRRVGAKGHRRGGVRG